MSGSPRLFGGCHLDRPIDQLIEGARLRDDRIETYFQPVGPRPMSWLYKGTAINEA